MTEASLFTPFPKTKAGFTLEFPFFYASASFFWVYYRARPDILAGFLEGTGLAPFPFKDHGELVTLNFQTYTAHLTNGLSKVTEVEFNIICYPRSRRTLVPHDISLADWLRGQDQSKLIGEFRLYVPADDAVAVEAGVKGFGERKFLTRFTYTVPNFNDQQTQTWDYTVHAPGDGSAPDDPNAPSIYRLRADVRDTVPQPGNISPFPLYTMLPGGPDKPPGNGRLNGLFRNAFGLSQHYFPLSAATREKIKLDLGKSGHPMRSDLARILDINNPVAVRHFLSPPAVAENRAFWVDPE